MALNPLRNSHPSHSVRGFTLVEMLAVMTVFVVITTITLASNSRFGGNITLETLAYDIALSVRQAQVYGIAVRRSDVGTSDFERAYGIHFNASQPTTYQLFTDIAEFPSELGDGRYDCPTPGDPNTCELVENTTMRGGYSIIDLCVRPLNQSEMCGQDELNVIFRRPEPDAYIRSDGVQTYEQARIVLGSPQGARANILIELAGQISVQ